MIMVICTIFDGKAEAYTNPMFFQSSGQAVRSFADIVNDGKSDFWAHPEDYTMFFLGTFDQRTGAIVMKEAPIALAQAIHLVDKDPGDVR